MHRITILRRRAQKMALETPLLLPTKDDRIASKVDIRILSDNDPMWDQIRSNTMFSIYHTKSWKSIVEETFKHSGAYITASENGDLVDALPFFLTKSHWMGEKLISTPYEGCNGGFSSPRVEVRKMLIERILEYALKLNVKYVEIRSGFPMGELKESGFIEKRPLLISEITLKNLDENWRRLSRNHRRNVRVAQKKGVSVVPASSWAEMEIFYELLVDHYKSLGTPFFGKKFFRKIWDKLIQQGDAHLLLAKFDQEIIGGHLLFFSGKTLISKYSACKKNKGFSKLYPAYALFWEGIRVGIDRHFRKFNLGITGECNTGLLDFKSRFGSKNRPVYFYYYPISGKIPDYARYYESHPLLKTIWRTAPRSLTTVLGQKINEWIC